MRILHFIPDIGVSNGVMRFILNYARKMPADVKFDVVYFMDTNENQKEAIEELGGCVYKVPSPGLNRAFGRAVKKIISEAEEKYSAIHIHVPYLTVFIAPIARKYGIKKIIAHGHTNCFSLNPANERRNKFFNWMTPFFASDCLAASHSAGQLWFGNKYICMRNAIDCSKYFFDENKAYIMKKELGIEDCFVVCHIGQTSIPQKNHPFLINVFNELVKIKPNSVLLLIGGKKTDALKKMTDEMGITDKVIYLGIQKNISDFLFASDVMVFPSISEGLGIAVIEAQAAGLACFVSEGVPREAFLTEKIKALSLNDPAKVWAEDVAQACLEDRREANRKVKEYGWDINENIESLLKIYKEA